MEVTVNLYGDARKYAAKTAFSLRVPSSTVVRNVLEYLKIPDDVPLAVVVNGLHRDRDYELDDLDVLSVFGMGAFASEPQAS